MSNLNLGQDVANKRVAKQTVGYIVAKYDPLSQDVGMRRYGSLININSSTAYTTLSVRNIAIAIWEERMTIKVRR